MSTSSARAAAWPAVPPRPPRLRAVPPPAPMHLAARVVALLHAYARRDEAERELQACNRALEEDLEIIERCCEMEVRHSLENRIRQTRSHLDDVHGKRGSGLRHTPRRRLPQTLWTHGG